MKQNFIKLLAVCAGCLLLSAVSLAQNNKRVSTVQDTYVISAKAGGVNFVSGKVAIVRQKGKSGYLYKGDSVEVGDKVLTGGGGKAEILLNPGSFVRLAGNSEFEFITTDLDDLQVLVTAGSAIFEVITDKEFRVVVNTPKSRFFIVKTGIYRVDTMGDGTAKLEVWKGKAQIGAAASAKPTTLKGGQTTVLNSAQVAVEKFDRDDKDEFELWSKERAKELDKLNAKLRAREMNQALLSSFSRDRWDISSRFGLWVRDPFSQYYCFLPFGYGWSSPYGFSYDRSIWNYQQTTNTVYANNPSWTPSNGGQTNSTPYPSNPYPGNSQDGGSNGGSIRQPLNDARPDSSRMPEPPRNVNDASPEPTRVKSIKDQ